VSTRLRALPLVAGALAALIAVPATPAAVVFSSGAAIAGAEYAATRVVDQGVVTKSILILSTKFNTFRENRSTE